jgi:glycosyltransferase involved in cell wall biosynthesis
MHIIITVNAAWNVVNFRRSLIEAFISDGHTVAVLAPPDVSVSVMEDLKLLGCRFLPLEMDRESLNPIKNFTLIGRMKKAFREERPDVIFSYTIKNNIFGSLAAAKLGIPFVPNITGLGTAFLSGRFLQKISVCLYRYAFRRNSITFFQNHDDKNFFLNHKIITNQQARLIPGSGIDLNHFKPTAYPSDHKETIFLMITRIIRDKGVLEYVETAREIKSKFPNVRFQILGSIDTANRNAIDAKIVQSWVNEGIIEYLGISDDVRPHISISHCIVLPSYREGAPRTLIEGASMARPVIASDVPGCREVVENSKTGYLCKARDKKDLMRCVNDFMTLQHEEKALMGRLGREKMVKSFDDSIVKKAYRKILEFDHVSQPIGK